MKRVKVIFILCLLLTGAIYVINGSKAAAAMFIIAALYAVFALALTMISGRKLKVSLSCDTAGKKGEPSKISISAENDSLIPVPSCEYKLSCRNRLTGEAQDMNAVSSYLPRGKQTDSIVLTGEHCGKEQVTIRDTYVSDPLKLFCRKSNAGAECAVYIMPDVREVTIPDDYLDSYDMESYTYSQHKSGQDPAEVFGVRNYQDGDSPKQIHWKLSAKMDDLIVKIPSFPIENKLVVLFDNTLTEGVKLSADKRNDFAEMFFSVSYSLIRKNIHHSIGWCDHESGGFVIRKVDNESDMWTWAPEVLGAGIEEGGLSTVYRFLMELGDEHFTNHFIVTCQDVKDEEKLEEYGAVRVFSC